MGYELLKPKNVVSLQVYPTNEFPDDFKQCTVSAIIDYEDTSLFGLDAIATHNRVFSELPTGTSPNAATLTYVVLKRPNGEKVCLAYEWIIEDSIQLYTQLTATVTITGVGVTDRKKLQEILQQAGYNVTEDDIVIK